MSFAVAFVLLLGAVCSEGQELNTTDPGALPKTVCYQLGGDSETCFSNFRPFNNANGKVPRSPSSIGTTFNLKTKSGQTIVTEQLSVGSLALENKDTKIIVHGWIDSQNAPWITELVSAFHDMGDFNVIVVDWSQGAKTSVRSLNSYYQSAANTRLVGAQIAFFVQALEKASQIPQSSVHIIGHSLGAQIAGYAGKRLPGLGRITGLDPAAPAFNENNSETRISPTDAAFVDVLHTDSGVFGLADAVGDADFYPNKGKLQPGCEAKDAHRGIFDLIQDFATKMPCSHMRAPPLFIESVKGTCQFQGYPCAPGAVCDDCGEKGCARMGYYSAVDNAAGSYYLSTTATAPFC